MNKPLPSELQLAKRMSRLGTEMVESEVRRQKTEVRHGESVLGGSEIRGQRSSVTGTNIERRTWNTEHRTQPLSSGSGH